jgi:uncharacterized membrane protein YfcA
MALSAKWKATIWYILTIIFAIFGIVWTWATKGEPQWWALAVSIVGMVVSAAFGISFTPPKPPV